MTRLTALRSFIAIAANNSSVPAKKIRNSVKDAGKKMDNMPVTTVSTANRAGVTIFRLNTRTVYAINDAYAFRSFLQTARTIVIALQTRKAFP